MIVPHKHVAVAADFDLVAVIGKPDLKRIIGMVAKETVYRIDFDRFIQWRVEFNGRCFLSTTECLDDHIKWNLGLRVEVVF